MAWHMVKPCQRKVTNVSPQVQTIPEFLESYFGYKSSMTGFTSLILVAYVLFFGTTAAMALRKLNFQKR
jgi:hypothetical protein